METIWVLTKSESNETNEARERCDRGRDVANEWEGSFCLNKYIGNVLSCSFLYFALLLVFCLASLK